MKETITANWLSDLAFEAEVNGHKVYMDSTVEGKIQVQGQNPL